jgi:hypothetical protein
MTVYYIKFLLVGFQLYLSHLHDHFQTLGYFNIIIIIIRIIISLGCHNLIYLQKFPFLVIKFGLLNHLTIDLFETYYQIIRRKFNFPLIGMNS